MTCQRREPRSTACAIKLAHTAAWAVFAAAILAIPIATWLGADLGGPRGGATSPVNIVSRAAFAVSSATHDSVFEPRKKIAWTADVQEPSHRPARTKPRRRDGTIDAAVVETA